MIHIAINYRLDASAFGALLLVSAFFMHRWLRRRHGSRGIGLLAWMLLLGITIAGAISAERSGLSERSRMRNMLDGIAPTYAQEFQLLGHQHIATQTSPDDPLYLKLIEAEKRWQKVNPNVNDIYTFRKQPDGSVILVVDSETDYDRDGKFEGERESRTAIGEKYDEADDNLMRAFEGTPSFDPEPYTDRWGTWVSAYVPMYDDAGHVEAVLGVDYDASRWANAIEWGRASTLGLAALLGTAVLAAATIVGVTRAELEKRSAAERALRASERRLRTILDAEPEWVQVTDRDGRITEINPAGVKTLGAASASEVLGLKLSDRVASEHLTAYAAWQKACLDGVGGVLRFAIEVNGTRRFIDAHAVPLSDAQNQISAMLGVLRDITEQQQANEERERLQRALVDASRQAGMAEVATGVLHNVGNVLNSVNVAAGVLTESIRKSKVTALRRAAGMMLDHRADLGHFMTEDAKGRSLPEFLHELSTLMGNQQDKMTKELASITSSIDHIKEIVSAQQAHAKECNTDESFDLAAVVDEAVRMNVSSLDHHGIELVRQYDARPTVLADRHKVVQILVNLIANAKKAVADPAAGAKRVTIGVSHITNEEGASIARVSVADAGVGIAPENMSKLFRHGFTTRADGHGFGLHSAAIAAKQMKGSLSAKSDGPGKGATFVLEIPVSSTGVLQSCQ